MRCPPITSPETSLATIQSARLATALGDRLLDDIARSPPRSRRADAGAAVLAPSSARMSRVGTKLSLGGPSPFLSFVERGSTRQSATAATRIAASAGKRRQDRVGHLLGGLDVDAVDAGGRFERHRPGDQRHSRAGLGGGGGDREALPARRAIGDDPHRIDRLVGRPGGDEDVLARESSLAEEVGRAESIDILRLGQAARAEFAARHLAFGGLDDLARRRP